MTTTRKLALRCSMVVAAAAVLVAPLAVGAAAEPPGGGTDFCREDVTGTTAAGPSIPVALVGHAATPGRAPVAAAASEHVVACGGRPACRWGGICSGVTGQD